PTNEPAPPSPEEGPSTGSPAGPNAPSAKTMASIRASTLASDLAAAGLSLDELPPLDEVVRNESQRRVVMRSFTQALGVECDGCHTAKKEDGKTDFSAPTPEKRVAEHMWNVFVRGLR